MSTPPLDTVHPQPYSHVLITSIPDLQDVICSAVFPVTSHVVSGPSHSSNTFSPSNFHISFQTNSTPSRQTCTQQVLQTIRITTCLNSSNKLTLEDTVLLDKLTGPQVVNIPPYYMDIPPHMKHEVHYPIHKIPPSVPILSHTNPVQVPTSLLNIFLSTPKSSKWSLSFGLSHRNPVCTTPLTMRATRPVHLF